MSKKQSKDSSKDNIATIHDLAEKFVETTVIDKFEQDNVSLSQQILELKKQLHEKEEKIKHLEDLLKFQVNSFSPVMEVTDEEMIALKQLERLKEAAQIRPLSLEEVRIYDLLVKNKRLAQGNATDVIDTIKLPHNKQDLLKLASKKIKDEQE
jgi:hypothetical protein